MSLSDEIANEYGTPTTMVTHGDAATYYEPTTDGGSPHSCSVVIRGRNSTQIYDDRFEAETDQIDARALIQIGGVVPKRDGRIEVGSDWYVIDNKPFARGGVYICGVRQITRSNINEPRTRRA